MRSQLLTVMVVLAACLMAAAVGTAEARALLSHKKGSTRTEPRQNEHSVEAATVATAGGDDWAELDDTAAGRRLAAAGRVLLSHKKGSTRTEPRQNEHSVEAATIATAGGEDWADLSDTADDTTAAGRRLAAAGRALLSHKKGSTEPEPRHNQHPKAILITNYAGWSDIGDVTDDALLSGRRLNAAGRALLSHKKGSTRTEPRQNEHSVEAATVATAGGEDWADLSDTADDTTAAGRRLAAAGRIMLEKTKGAKKPDGRNNIPGANTLPTVESSDSGGDAGDAEDDGRKK